jgi:hypothetical protein
MTFITTSQKIIGGHSLGSSFGFWQNSVVFFQLRTILSLLMSINSWLLVTEKDLFIERAWQSVIY